MINFGPKHKDLLLQKLGKPDLACAEKEVCYCPSLAAQLSSIWQVFLPRKRKRINPLWPRRDLASLAGLSVHTPNMWVEGETREREPELRPVHKSSSYVNFIYLGLPQTDAKKLWLTSSDCGSMQS